MMIISNKNCYSLQTYSRTFFKCFLVRNMGWEQQLL